MGEPARKRDTEQAPAAFDAQAWLTLATAPGVPPASRRAARRMTRLDSFPYAFFSVGALAGALDCSKDTARRALRGLETRDLLDREDFFGKWKEQRSNNYQAKMPPGRGPSHTVGSVPGGRSQAASPIKRRGGEQKKKEQQSARPPAPACEVVPPAAAAPCVAPVPSVASVAPVASPSSPRAVASAAPSSDLSGHRQATQPPEPPRSLGRSEPVPHPTAPSPAPSRAVLDAGTAHPEPGTSVAVIVDPDDARIMELDGPQLAKCQPCGVQVPERHLMRIAETFKPTARKRIEELLRGDPMALAHPEAARDAVMRLAAETRERVRNPSGFFRAAIGWALEGTLSTPTEPAGQTRIGTLDRILAEAEQGAAPVEPGLVREVKFREGRREQRELAQMRAPLEHQHLVELGRALKPPVLPGPREIPPGVPRTNRALFRVPDD